MIWGGYMTNQYLLQDYFLQATHRFPDKIAVKYEGKAITYHQLLEHCLHVEQHLLRIGVKSKDMVGLYSEKTDSALTCIFGILQTGAVYIPLDAVASPVARVVQIMKQSDMKCLIVPGKRLEKIAADASFDSEIFHKIKILDLDGTYSLDKSLFAGYEKMDWTGAVNVALLESRNAISLDTACILYTSGSTGEPKGVMLSHRNVRSFIDWCICYFQPDKEERFVSIAPFHFDLSIFDLYVPLACGASLFLPSRKSDKNPLRLWDEIVREEITCVYCVPSLWIALLKYGKKTKKEFGTIKRILYAGERFPENYLKQLLYMVPQAEIYNLYGLIETNVFTYYPIAKDEVFAKGSVPIGFVCENSDAMVINQEKQMVEKGEEGELCVRGETVMQGYYNKEELTRDCFIKSPYPEHRGANYYRTGDIVYQRNDGAYQLVGRNDQLVKRDGYRVELAEIENAMGKWENVLENIVVAFTDEEGRTQICAVVLPQQSCSITFLTMKSYLSRWLPTYMIPDDCYVVTNMTRNSNGKIDRQALKKACIQRRETSL